MRIKRRTFNQLAVAGAASGLASPAIAQAKPLTIGFGMALTGGLAPNGKAALLAMQICGRGHQRQGRHARPAGEAGLLRRPVQSLDGARPLHQAAGRRQGRHRRQRLRHQHDRAGDADRDAARSDVLRPARPRGEQRVQLPALLLDRRRPAGRKPKQVFAEGFFEVAMAQNPKPTDAGHGRRRRRVPAQRAWTACAAWPRSSVSRSSTTRPIRRPPPTTRRSCARSRPPIRTSSSPRPIRPNSVGIIRAASEIGFKPKIFGGGMVGLQATAIKTQLGPLLNGIVVYDFWLPWAGFATRRGPRLPEEVPGEVGGGRRRPAGLLPAALRLRPACRCSSRR